MNKSYSTFFAILILLAFSSCSSNKKIACKYFINEPTLETKNAEVICDSLSLLKDRSKFLFINFTSEAIEQKERRVTSTLLFAKETLSIGAVIFVYNNSERFDIVFSDSLKNEKFLIDRMKFVNTVQLYRKLGANSTFFNAIISEFKKIEAE